ncbi:MAG: hypothetical protein ACRCYS_14505, partial [Beijerinckiaceae bacterium]
QPQHQQGGGFQRPSDPGEQPQPEGQPFIPRERPQFDRNDRQDRGPRQDRGDRQDRPERSDRPDRGERPAFEAGEGGETRSDRPERGDRPDRGDRRNRFDRNRNDRNDRPNFRDRRPPQGGEAEADAGLPAFITGGAPRPALTEGGETGAPAPADGPEAAHDEARHPFRQRRRRRFGAEGDAAEAAPEAPRGEAVE